MNILDALKQLRDDIKTWVANNLNELNTRLVKTINNIPKFSGNYNDLTDAPNITEDDSGNMVIADESGNVIFKADSDGIHTTAVSLNGEAAASQKYVNEAIANNVPKVDFTGYATEDFVTSAIDSAKEELSESIVAESDEWKVVDEAGNIIFSVDATGAHTTSMTLDGQNIEEMISNKVDKVDGKGLSTNDFTNEYKDKLDNLNGTGGGVAVEEDPTVPAWAKEATKPSYTADEVGALSKDTPLFSGNYNDLENAPDITEDGSGNLIITDEQGNIILQSNGDGFETVNLIVQNITINGKTIQEMIQDYVNEAILGGVW